MNDADRLCVLAHAIRGPLSVAELRVFAALVLRAGDDGSVAVSVREIEAAVGLPARSVRRAAGGCAAFGMILYVQNLRGQIFGRIETNSDSRDNRKLTIRDHRILTTLRRPIKFKNGDSFFEFPLPLS